MNQEDEQLLERVRELFKHHQDKHELEDRWRAKVDRMLEKLSDTYVTKTYLFAWLLGLTIVNLVMIILFMLRSEVK